MVFLSRIYTKSGDTGDTSLGDGRRVAKGHPRVEAYGQVDELNAVLGLAAAQLPEGDERDILRRIQNDLFDVGADLCVPQTDEEQPGQCLRIQPAQAEKLETEIDQFNERLQPLNSFILPGGSQLAAWLHLARTVCRRAERQVVTMMHDGERINPHLLVYLNRLSDWLFVFARIVNDEGRSDVLWVPGQSAKTN